MSLFSVTARHPGAYPLLARALHFHGRAYSVKIEWLLTGEDGKTEVAYNYTQIFRGPSAENVCAQIEAALLTGVRKLDLTTPRSYMGGVRFFDVGKEPNLYLRVLRDLTKIGDGDYVAEVGVIVRRAE